MQHQLINFFHKLSHVKISLLDFHLLVVGRRQDDDDEEYVLEEITPAAPECAQVTSGGLELLDTDDYAGIFRDGKLKKTLIIYRPTKIQHISITGDQPVIVRTNEDSDYYELYYPNQQKLVKHWYSSNVFVHDHASICGTPKGVVITGGVGSSSAVSIDGPGDEDYVYYENLCSLPKKRNRHCSCSLASGQVKHALNYFEPIASHVQ